MTHITANKVAPSLDTLGQQLIALGQAMRNSNTTASELAELTHVLGHRLRIRPAKGEHCSFSDMKRGTAQ